MLRVFQNFEWEVPISGDRDGGGAGRGKNDEIEDLGNGGQQLRRCKFHGFPSPAVVVDTFYCSVQPIFIVVDILNLEKSLRLNCIKRGAPLGAPVSVSPRHPTTTRATPALRSTATAWRSGRWPCATPPSPP